MPLSSVMTLLVGLTVVAVLVGVIAWDVARRRRVGHAFWWLPLAFCLTGALGATLALRGGESGRAECVINHEITDAGTGEVYADESGRCSAAMASATSSGSSTWTKWPASMSRRSSLFGNRSANSRATRALR